MLKKKLASELENTVEINDSVMQLERVLAMLDEIQSDLKWYEMKVAEESDL